MFRQFDSIVYFSKHPESIPNLHFSLEGSIGLQFPLIRQKSGDVYTAQLVPHNAPDSNNRPVSTSYEPLIRH